MAEPLPTTKADRRWIGAAFVTLVFAVLATIDQTNGPPDNPYVLGGLALMGLRWFGESILDLLRAVSDLLQQWTGGGRQ